MDKELIGMWKYAISPYLRKSIKIARTKILCLQIDKTSFYTDTVCACFLSSDCPFLCKNTCLAPDRGLKDERYLKDFMYRQYGCFLLSYCKRGYNVYLNLHAWKRRALKVKRI